MNKESLIEEASEAASEMLALLDPDDPIVSSMATFIALERIALTVYVGDDKHYSVIIQHLRSLAAKLEQIGDQRKENRKRMN